MFFDKMTISSPDTVVKADKYANTVDPLNKLDCDSLKQDVVLLFSYCSNLFWHASYKRL
jgi:hypothetical protein